MERKLVLLILLSVVIVSWIPVNASMVTLPNIQLPLAPPAQVPPYDDNEFFELSNTTISLICTGESLPVGSMNNAVHDSLASTYYSLIRMNISEENYSKAEKITSFLSYTLTLEEKYEDYEKEKEKYSPVDMGITSYEELEEWYDAASGVWKQISSWYPDAKMYEMPSAIESKNWTVGQFPVV